MCVQDNIAEPWDPFGPLCSKIAQNKKVTGCNFIQWRNVYTKFLEKSVNSFKILFNEIVALLFGNCTKNTQIQCVGKVSHY
jgi:hypothetical protein